MAAADPTVSHVRVLWVLLRFPDGLRINRKFVYRVLKQRGCRLDRPFRMRHMPAASWYRAPAGRTGPPQRQRPDRSSVMKSLSCSP